MAKFNPRDIPGRERYNQLMEWALGVFTRPSFILPELQKVISDQTTDKAKSGSDEEKMCAVLAELGFCAVIDRMAEIIEEHEGKVTE